MTSQQPRAFIALDLGSATVSAALVGHVGGRWRLIGHTSAPCCIDPDVLATGLLRRINDADREILSDLGAPSPFDPEALALSWPRFTASTASPRRIAVLAGSKRQWQRLEAVALRSGWRVVGGSAEDSDPMDLERAILSPGTHAILLGADRSPAGDDRRNLPDLAAMVAAATRTRPELTVVLAGGAAAYESVFFEVGRPAAAKGSSNGSAPSVAVEVATPANDADNRSKGKDSAASKTTSQERLPDDETVQGVDETPSPEAASDAEPQDHEIDDAVAPEPELHAAATAEADPEETDAAEPSAATAEASAPEAATAEAVTEPASAAETVLAAAPYPVSITADMPVAHVLLAPDAEAGTPAGSMLQQVLEGLREEPNDSRLNIARSIASLAYVLDRTIEVAEVGLQGGLMARSEPFGHGHFLIVSSHACLVDGSFAPADPSDDVIDGLTAWSTQAIDRHRLTDRLVDMRIAPWGNSDGDGATFRLAAAKAALSRLVAATPEISDRPMPELLIAAGGILSSLPASVVALALADIIRRAGITQVSTDPARVLGPIGTIEDEGERRRLLANLADDILLPLGSLVVPAGVKPGKNAGNLRLKGSTYVSEIELHPGAIQVVDLPGGRSATADLEFRDTVRLGSRGHHFSMEVSGGLVGLLVDLRDVPMRISDRPETRRAALEAWQKGMWPEVDE